MHSLNYDDMKTYFGISQKNFFLSILILLVIFAGVRAFSSEKEKLSEERIEKVNIANVDDFLLSENSVSVVGEVESLSQVQLKSETTAQVTRVNAKIGQKVRRGDILLSLRNADLVAQLQQAQANIEDAQIGVKQLEAGYEQSQIKLDELQSGTRSEELEIAQTEVQNAERQIVIAKEKANIDLQNLYNDIPNFLQSIYIAADDAMNREIGGVFSNTQEYTSDLPQLAFQTFDSQSEIDAEWGRHLARVKLRKFKQEMDALPADNELRYDYLDTAKGYIAEFLPILESTNKALDGAVALSETERNTIKAQVNSARSTINGSIQKIDDYKHSFVVQENINQNAITSAENNLKIALKKLTLAQAGPRQEQVSSQVSQVTQSQLNIESQKARVKQAQASAALIQAQLAKTVIRSPIDGEVASIPLKLGDLATNGSLLASVVNTDGFQIKAYISAQDINRVAVGSKVLSDGNEIGEVTQLSPSIDPLTKKVQLVIPITDPNFHVVVGEFINIEIVSGSEDEQLTYLIPLEAIQITSTGSYIYTLENDSVTKRNEVTLGRVVGDRVEVLFGLDQGMKILSSARGISENQKVRLDDTYGSK